MITPTNINSYINAREKPAAPTNFSQQNRFLNLLDIDSHSSNLMAKNTATNKSNSNLNFFAESHLFQPQINQESPITPVNLHTELDTTPIELENQKTINTQKAIDIINSYFSTDGTKNILAFEQVKNIKIAIPQDNKKIAGELGPFEKGSTNNWLNENLTKSDVSTMEHLSTLHNMADYASIGVTPPSFDAKNIFSTCALSDTSHVVLQFTQQSANYSFQPANSVSQHSIKISNSVDLKWYATGKLSLITRVAQNNNRLTLSNLADKSATLETPNQATLFENSMVPSLSQSDSESKAYPSYLKNKYDPSNEKKSIQSLLSTAIALSFPELSKRKITITESSGEVDVIVRDYNISEEEKKVLNIFLNYHFKNIGKPIHSLTFNGKIYS